jgi:hypothetical protein
MPQLVCNSAVLSCSMGSVPAPLTVLPELPVLAGGQPAAVIGDIAPEANIPSFAMCNSLANPAVAAATAAADGVLTPQPCVPVPTGPWFPGSTRLRIGGQPALIGGSACMCAWAGEISMSFCGQVRVTIEC